MRLFISLTLLVAVFLFPMNIIAQDLVLYYPFEGDGDEVVAFHRRGAGFRKFYFDAAVHDHRDHGVDEKDEQQKYHVDQRQHFHPRFFCFVSGA